MALDGWWAMTGRGGSAISTWMAMWRLEHVEFHSPLSVEVAEERLAAEISPPRRRPWQGPGAAPIDLVGRVKRRRVWVCALPRTVRQNSWAPVLRAELSPRAPHGSRLGGSVGWPPSVRVLTVVWFVVAACLLVAGVVAEAISLAAGRGLHDALWAVLFALVMIIWYVTLSWYGDSRGRVHRAELLERVRTALEAR